MDKKKLYYVVQPGTNARVINGKDPLILDEAAKLNREKLNRQYEEIMSIEDYENKFTEPDEIKRLSAALGNEGYARILLMVRDENLIRKLWWLP